MEILRPRGQVAAWRSHNWADADELGFRPSLFLMFTFTSGQRNMFDFFFLRRYSSAERMLYILYYYLPFSLYNIWCISLCKNNYITEPFKRCIMFVILPFHTVHGVLEARILKWFAIIFSSRPHSVRPLHHDPSLLGGPTHHGLGWLS